MGDLAAAPGLQCCLAQPWLELGVVAIATRTCGDTQPKWTLALGTAVALAKHSLKLSGRHGGGGRRLGTIGLGSAPALALGAVQASLVQAH